MSEEAFIYEAIRTPRGKADPLADLDGAADLVVVDAPCTGTGTWRRNPDAKWRLRPGSLSLRLSNSVGRAHLDVDLDDGGGSGRIDRTPWLKIDDVFYEARGACWALIQLMQAAEIDFDEVLRRKNAQVSMRQMIRELEATQEAVWSPMILNGSGFGVLANHSLVMANYISRANAQLIDLRALLSQG